MLVLPLGSGDVGGWAKDRWEEAKDAGSSLKDGVKAGWNEIEDGAEAAWDGIEDGAEAAWDGIEDGWDWLTDDSWNWIIDNAAELLADPVNHGIAATAIAVCLGSAGVGCGPAIIAAAEVIAAKEAVGLANDVFEGMSSGARDRLVAAAKAANPFAFAANAGLLIREITRSANGTSSAMNHAEEASRRAKEKRQEFDREKRRKKRRKKKSFAEKKASAKAKAEAASRLAEARLRRSGIVPTDQRIVGYIGASGLEGAAVSTAIIQNLGGNEAIDHRGIADVLANAALEGRVQLPGFNPGATAATGEFSDRVPGIPDGIWRDDETDGGPFDIVKNHPVETAAVAAVVAGLGWHFYGKRSRRR